MLHRSHASMSSESNDTTAAHGSPTWSEEPREAGVWDEAPGERWDGDAAGSEPTTSPGRAGEGPVGLLLSLNVFLLLTAYYLVKPVREALILALDSGAEYPAGHVPRHTTGCHDRARRDPRLFFHAGDPGHPGDDFDAAQPPVRARHD